MRPILLLILGGTLLQAETPNPARQADEYHAKGLIAEKAGDPVTARESYMRALQLNPKHANSIYRLGELKRNAGSISAKGREAKFGQVVIPQIVLEGATLSEALDALRLSMEKASDGATTPNFIMNDPANTLASARVSLQLKNVPAKGVLEYILSQSAAKATYDEHAVVIAPRVPGS